jgi:glycine cleavage system T protein
MKKTPLYKTHLELGATFAKVHEDWELVAHFTDPQTEHHAIRNSVGILDRSHRGRLRLTGDDRMKYLNRIISNEVEKLKVGDGNYATILTNRGKIIADMKVLIFEPSIGIDTNAETTGILFQELDKYIIADDVMLEDLTDETGLISVYGPKSAALVQAILGVDVSALAEHQSVVHHINDQWIVCARTNETGEIGYNLYMEATLMEGLWDASLTKGQDFDVQPVGLTAFDSLRIEAGTPQYGAELDDSIMPLEAELEHAIDFEKGCYIGQEIVARMKYRGHPNRLLRGLEIDHNTPPQQGDRIFDGQKDIGWITSAVPSPTLGKTIALGYVRMAFTDSGSTVEVESAGGRMGATVVHLPFYKR